MTPNLGSAKEREPTPQTETPAPEIQPEKIGKTLAEVLEDLIVKQKKIILFDN